MSRRGRRSESPISLFSFQDIITSVTAIMILLVLILTLELITRQEHQGVAADDRRTVEQLTQSIDAMRARCRELERQTSNAQQTADHVAAQSAREVESEIRGEQRRAEALRQELASLATKAREARQARRAAESELLKAERAGSAAQATAEQAGRLAAAAARVEESNDREQKRQKAVREDLAGQPKGAAKLVFNPPVGQELKPILVEVSSNGVAVMNESGTAARDFEWGITGPPNRFIRWLEQRDKNREYVVIILRPSGLQRLEAMRTAISAAGLELGVELVSEEMDIVMRGS